MSEIFFKMFQSKAFYPFAFAKDGIGFFRKVTDSFCNQ